MLSRSAAIVLLTSTLLAQQVPQPNSDATTTLRTGTQLVLVDVTVTDSHHKPVHNLTAADFTVLEDNVPQSIRNFEEHSYAPAQTPTAPQPALPPGVFTNQAAARPTGALNILLLDTLNTPVADQGYVRAQIKQYLRNAPNGTRIAIFGLATHLYLLQRFTTDPAILRAAIDGKSASRTSQLLDDATGGGNGSTPLSRQFTNAFIHDDIDTTTLAGNLEQFEAEQQSAQLQLRAKYTLEGLNQLARYLSALEGRKNLIWFSGAFPINILPDGSLSRPFAVMASSEEEFRQTADLLARSQVAVYPVDARGITASPILTASDASVNNSVDVRKFDTDLAKANDQLNDEHSTMLRMAEQTGGHAYINTNGLTQAVADVTENGANYYTLAYTPANPQWDRRYRKIQVRTPNGKYTLSYRRGYFADDPQAPQAPLAPRSSNTAATLPAATYDAMRAAMTHGAPEATQIVFRARIVPASAATEETLAAGVAASSSPKVKPPYRRYNVIFAADPRHIHFTQSADGKYVGQVRFLTYVYDRDGQLITYVGNEIHANIPPEGYAAMFRGGLHFSQQISVPDKGDYSLRVGVYDVDGDHAGTVELPVAAVQGLPPA